MEPTGVVAIVEASAHAANATARVIDSGTRMMQALSDAKAKPVPILRNAEIALVSPLRDGSAVVVFDGERCDAKGVCKPDVVVVHIPKENLPTVARQFADVTAASANIVAADAAKVAADAKGVNGT